MEFGSCGNRLSVSELWLFSVLFLKKWYGSILRTSAIFSIMPIDGNLRPISISPISAADAKYWSCNAFWESTESYCLGLQSGSNTPAVLVYVDKNVTINGTNTLTLGGSTDRWTANNVTLLQGWNYLIWVSADNSDNGRNHTYTAARTLPAGYDWKVSSNAES